MKPAVRFLIIYFAVYAAVTVLINILFGPPELSEEYMQVNRKQHERYITISKSPEYKLYLERPALHPPTPANAAAFAFADEYQTREAFLAEEHRRTVYENLLDVFKVAMVVLLAARFGARPLMGFLDNQIAHVRHRLEKAAEQRRVAEERRLAAQNQLAALDQERQRLIDESAQRAALERSQIEESTGQALAHLALEEADRLKYEELIARRRAKKALVDEAMRLLVERYQAARTAESEAALVAQFVEQMEKTR